jgi:hypothetical protein
MVLKNDRILSISMHPVECSLDPLDRWFLGTPRERVGDLKNPRLRMDAEEQGSTLRGLGDRTFVAHKGELKSLRKRQRCTIPDMEADETSFSACPHDVRRGVSTARVRH